MDIMDSDFDDEDISVSEGEPSGLAATEVFSQTPAGVNLLAGTSSNPLDDLVSIFGGGNGGGVVGESESGVGQGGRGEGPEGDLLGLF